MTQVYERKATLAQDAQTAGSNLGSYNFEVNFLTCGLVNMDLRDPYSIFGGSHMQYRKLSIYSSILRDRGKSRLTLKKQQGQ